MSRYFTTPIYYPNAKLHMGHAYTTTLADISKRAAILKGEKSYLLTGSDENTQKMVDAARKAGKEPLQYLDEIVTTFKTLYAKLNISYDQFIRTTDQKKHWKGAEALWKRIDAAGDFYKKEYEGLYCVGHEAFITEKELVDGKCPDHGTVPEHLKEENYFFKLSKYGDVFKQKIESGELLIVPESRKNEILSFISEGLQDVSFSRPRRKDWPEGLGVPVPGDPDHIMYVWCDALANYITALGFGSDDDALYQEFWPGTHIIGKDILRFHAAIWPAMLLSAGLPLPKTIFVHGLITSGGKKMSKSLGNVIDPEELLTKYGTDAVRYYLARHISPFEDSDLTRESFHNAYNGELVNGLGNLVARIMTLAEQHISPVELTQEDTKIEASYLEKFEAFTFNEAADLLWEHIAKGDVYMTEQAPYKKIKSENEAEREEAKKVIEKLVRHLAKVAAHLAPLMPATADAILSAIRQHKKPANLFPRIDISIS